jgi:hypothetical protein
LINTSNYSLFILFDLRKENSNLNNKMRPTKLNFRSPKEISGEFLYPMVKNDGTSLNYIRRNRRIEQRNPSETKKFTTFSNE